MAQAFSFQKGSFSLRLYEERKSDWLLLLPVLKSTADGSKSDTEFLKVWERLQWDPDCASGISY